MSSDYLRGRKFTEPQLVKGQCPTCGHPVNGQTRKAVSAAIDAHEEFRPDCREARRPS